MRSLLIPLAVFVFVIITAGAAPAVHAQALSNSCTSDFQCPNGQRCDFTIGGRCVASSAPSGNTTLSPGGNTGGSLLQPGGNTGSNVTLINPLNSGNCTPNGSCLMDFLNKILRLVIQVGAVAVVLMLVYVGYLFVVAQGNETKLTTAKTALLWTIVGALVLLGSQAISLGIQATVQALSTGN